MGCELPLVSLYNFTFYIDSHAEIQTRSKVNYAALCSTLILLYMFVALPPICNGT